MVIHRFRELLTGAHATEPQRLAGVFSDSFVACSLSMFGGLGQQACVQQIYQLASAMTQAQLQPTPTWPPRFSLN